MNISEPFHSSARCGTRRLLMAAVGLRGGWSRIHFCLFAPPARRWIFRPFRVERDATGCQRPRPWRHPFAATAGERQFGQIPGGRAADLDECAQRNHDPRFNFDLEPQHRLRRAGTFRPPIYPAASRTLPQQMSTAAHLQEGESRRFAGDGDRRRARTRCRCISSTIMSTNFLRPADFPGPAVGRAEPDQWRTKAFDPHPGRSCRSSPSAGITLEDVRQHSDDVDDDCRQRVR